HASVKSLITYNHVCIIKGSRKKTGLLARPARHRILPPVVLERGVFPAMARKTREEALETRQRILDTAARMFGQHGIAATSLQDIAAAADVSRGAIYWHFKNK